MNQKSGGDNVTITVNADESLIRQADEILKEWGLNIEDYFIACFEVLVRERKVPFEHAVLQQKPVTEILALASKDFIEKQVV